MTVTAVEARTAQILERTRAASMRPLLKSIGHLLDVDSRAAFTMQRWGPFAWDPKYPNQSGGNFISLAGALADFEMGRSEPTVKQFNRRPALMGRRTLFNSVRHRIAKRNVVEQGSWLPYAGNHNQGIGGTQNVSDGAKKRIEAWLDTPFGSQFRSKIGFLTDPQRSILDTEVNQRPFVGIYDEQEVRIRRKIEGYFNA